MIDIGFDAIALDGWFPYCPETLEKDEFDLCNILINITEVPEIATEEYSEKVQEQIANGETPDTFNQVPIEINNKDLGYNVEGF